MKNRRRAFTVVELLVVVAITGVLLALLLPAVQAAREAARRANCASNLKQIGLAILSYHSALSSFPPGNINNHAGNCPGMAEPTTSYSTHFGNWAIAILPYLDQTPLFDRYDLRHLNEGPENQVRAGNGGRHLRLSLGFGHANAGRARHRPGVCRPARSTRQAHIERSAAAATTA